MRSFFVFALTCALSVSALAQEEGRGVLPPEATPPSMDDLDAPTTEVEPPGGPAPAITPQDEKKGATLDTLFEDLAQAPDAKSALPVVARIQRIWMTSGSATVDLLMRRSALAIKGKELGLALDLADMVVRLSPEYAEGYNRRATIHYLNGDFGAAIKDIERVLALEPRHWGAMSGLGIILRRLDREDEALVTFQEVLRLNPHAQNARKAVEALDKKAAGQGI